MSLTLSQTVIGIIGGSGLYDIDGLKNISRKKIVTPFGKPSDEFVIGELQGVPFVFLPRHGKGHTLNPSDINYRANIYGMKKCGVTSLFSLSAVGSMKEEISPGDVVIVDQFIDRTKGYRNDTFFEKGLVAHVAFADPICPALLSVAHESVKKVGITVHKGGTYLCMEGPQFSTRAESLLYRQWGVSVIGMTNIPEVKLAREAEMCYASIVFSTDYDCWKASEEVVSADKVLAMIKKNVDIAKRIILEIPAFMKTKKACECGHALQHALVTDRLKISKKLKRNLTLLIGKYI